jgi:hypothetical protein
MLEYFTFKKIKKHQAEAQHRAETKVQTPLLDEDDEHFLERMISAEGTPPPLPDRPNWQTAEAGDSTGNKSQLVLHDGREAPANGHHRKDKGKGKEKENGKTDTKTKRMSFLQRTFTKKVCSHFNEGNIIANKHRAAELQRMKRSSPPMKDQKKKTILTRFSMTSTWLP